MEKDIARAVQREREYLVRKERGEEVKIFDFIGPCGYSDVNEFYWDKQFYLFRTQNWANVEEPYITLDFTAEYFRNQTPAFLWTIDCPIKYAFIPNDFENIDLLVGYGLEPLKIGYTAQNGIIISSDGDLRIFLIYPGEIEILSEHFLGFFRDTLEEVYENVTIDKNDVLIDGKKVIGTVLFPHMNMNVFVAQVTYTSNKALIKEICGETAKIPGKIDKTLISPYTLKNRFAQWLGL